MIAYLSCIGNGSYKQLNFKNAITEQIDYISAVLFMNWAWVTFWLRS